jgi:hypothetical protein
MANYYFLDRNTSRNPNLRAADADRERIAEHLRQSHAEGRLDLTEFQQRLERCYEAKTVSELDELVTDLPWPGERDEPTALGWSRPRRMHLSPLAPILIALIVISAATGHGLFWLWIPLLFVLWRMSWSHRRRSWADASRSGRLGG